MAPDNVHKPEPERSTTRSERMIRFKRILALKSMFKTSGRAPVALVLNIAQQNL